MLTFVKDEKVAEMGFSFGAVEVSFPEAEKLNIADFRSLVDEEIAILKEKYAEYDRKAVWGENTYYRFFKKFKKTYPVMLQFESAVLKDRPFPNFNPISEIAFLLEITTFTLSGAHDADSIDGDVKLYIADSKEDFEGMRETLHTYPNDFCARDNQGIIFSEIAGTDSRTCAKQTSRNVLYPVFATPDTVDKDIEKAMARLSEYIKVLAPDAEISCRII